MFKIDHQINAIINKRCEQVLEKRDIEFIKNYENLEHKELVYTSFDGDYMHYLHDMQEFVLKKNLIPINPEAALGYYVSTSTHGSKKIPVMLDCITTELLCDYMWIFNPKTGYIPEGILAEMMIWEREKAEDILIYNFFPNETSPIDKYDNIDMVTLCHQSIKEYIKSNWSNEELDEIKKGLMVQYEKQKIKSAYIIANFYNYKHIDWARKYCYIHHVCPICVHTLLPFYLYNKIFDDGHYKYLKDRLTILNKLKEVYVFLNKKRIEDEIYRLDYYSICELYFLINNRNDEHVYIIGWDEAEVPKYSNSLQWALTTKETREVM